MRSHTGVFYLVLYICCLSVSIYMPVYLFPTLIRSIAFYLLKRNSADLPQDTNPRTHEPTNSCASFFMMPDATTKLQSVCPEANGQLYTSS